MAQREIEQWAKILQEAEAEDRAYESACQKAMKEAEEATSYENVELDAEDEIIDPASLGFVNSEDLFSRIEKRMLYTNRYGWQSIFLRN